MPKFSNLVLALALIAVPSAALRAEEAPAPAAAPSEPIKEVTEHRLRAGDVDLSYTVTAEEIYIRDGDGTPTASFFTISYMLNEDAGREPRPVTFIYNGGPGSASIWLHFGMIGPRIVDLPSDGSHPGSPPYRLKDNPWTLLRATDLIFVDPVGTGFSKALGESKDADFWGFDEDADSVAEFIRAFITQHNRWNSPKYILGESYGGLRSGLLVPRLQGQLGIYLDGVILVSPALNMGTLPFFVAGNDLPFVTHLPALAATAHYHDRLPDDWPSLEALLEEVEAWAGTEYLTALFRGDLLSDAERRAVAAQLRRYTGLSEDYILRSDLRIFAPRFIKELLRDQGKVVGLLDGRYSQEELDDVADFPNGDPFTSNTEPAYVATFQHFLRNDLGIDLVKRYVSLNRTANQSWKRPRGGQGAFAGYVDVTGPLAQGTKDNEALRIFSAGGYHDLTTSYYATEYMLHHSEIDPDRMVIENYEGGHMMYLYEPSLEKLSNDIVEFIESR